MHSLPSSTFRRIPVSPFMLLFLLLTVLLHSSSAWPFPISSRRSFLPLRPSSNFLRTSHPDALPSAPSHQWHSLFIQRQLEQAPLFISKFDDPELIVALTNGTAEAQITYVFIPKPNFTISDYNIVPQIADSRIAQPEDVSFFFVEDTSRDFLAYNVTVNIDFNKWTGTSAFQISALNATTSDNVASSASVSIIIVGITLYRNQQQGDALIFGGDNYPFVLSYQEVLQSRDQNFQVFIQYFDGSSTNSSITVPLEGIDISAIGETALVTYEDSCSATSGTYDGSDVSLPSSCGIAFSTNSLQNTYIGPRFGIDFMQYRNGTFMTYFEWNQVLQGSDLENDGYSTFLNVSIQGEVPPIMKFITPSAPFSTTGDDNVVLTLSNLPTSLDVASSWTYSLFINFTEESREATFVEGSVVVYQNSSASVTFNVPAGSGVDLPWRFIATKPTGEQLVAVDQTQPPYLFSFADSLAIGTIAPSSGPTTGGTAVTLTGNFPGYDSANISIFFDGVLLDPSLITSNSSDTISFTTPPKGDDGNLEQTVTVSIGNFTSNGVSFKYSEALELESISPSSGTTEGGTLVTVRGQFPNFDSSAENSGIYFGSRKLESSSIQTSNATVITFLTPSWASLEDSRFVFDVTVQIGGNTSRALQFSYNTPLVIGSMTPSSGTEAGGTEVTLSGQFKNFNLATSKVLFGATSIDASKIIFFNDTVVQFSTPPLSEVGRSYSQSVAVTSGTFTSNTVYFTYEESNPSTSITSTGGSLDSSTGQYRLGRCGTGAFRAVVSSGWRVLNLTYDWVLTAANSDSDILSSESIISSAETVVIPPSAFQNQNEEHSLTLTVTSALGSEQTNLTVVQLSTQPISVQIIDPRTRSPSDPNVSLTIPSWIGLPACSDPEVKVNSSALTFLWEYRNAIYSFSYLNKTVPKDKVGPTLLGREFYVPQALMEYGSFSLSLTVYYTEQPEFRTSDSSSVVIQPASLLAQINGGEVSQFISTVQDFPINALGSRDPDVLISDASSGLRYSWSCQYSWNSTLDEAQQCDSGLMPDNDITAPDFLVSGSAFTAVQNSTGPMYIRYSLQVSKTSQNATGADLERTSKTVYSTLILPSDGTQPFELLQEIVVVNNQSAAVDRSNVKYYEDVTITPVSATKDATWSFQLLLPVAQSQLLLSTDNNLLTLPTYYTAKDKGEAGRASLGIKANALLPNTQYTFLISTFRIGFASNEQTIILKTVEKPIIKFARLATPSGTTNDTYTLSAYANYDGDFKFFFLVTDEFEFETCVGGCQGAPFVSFKIGTNGTYAVRCDVYDSLGFTLLADVKGGNITVSSVNDSMTDLSVFSEDAEKAFVAGDHSDYQQIGTDMVKYIISLGGSQAVELDSERLANFTEGLNQIAGNSVPNAIQSTGFVRTAAALASLTPELGIIYSTETLYFMVNVTINAVQRTPDNAALRQVEDLLDFYNLTPELILSSTSGGTSRRRLRQNMEANEQEVIGIWLDVYEVMKEQIALTVLKKCPCGCVEEVRTGISSKTRVGLSSRLLSVRQDLNLSGAAAYENPSQGELSQVRMKVAHFCNSEQGSELVIDEGDEQEIRFSWCKGVYEDSIKRLYFVVAKTPDYVYLSRLHRNVTLTDGLIGTMVGEIQNNSMRDASAAIQNCYSIQVPIPRNVALFSKTAPEEQLPQGLLLRPQKRWEESEWRGLYAPVFGNISTLISVEEGDENYSSAELRLSTPGVVTVATQYAWQGAVLSLEGLLVLGMQVVGVMLIVGVLVIGAVVGTWRMAADLAGGAGFAVVEADATYVERDTYGRGTAFLG